MVELVERTPDKAEQADSARRGREPEQYGQHRYKDCHSE